MHVKQVINFLSLELLSKQFLFWECISPPLYQSFHVKAATADRHIHINFIALMFFFFSFSSLYYSKVFCIIICLEIF